MPCAGDRSRFAWTDVAAFEYLLAEAQRRGDAGDEEGAVGTVERAIGLYRGYFLAGGDHPWPVRMRERLHRLFALNVAVLAAFAMKKGDFTRCMAWYEQGLEVDPTCEELYRQAMRTCITTGLHGEALALYRRCCHSLATELGIAPSPATVALSRQAREQQIPPE